MDDLFSDTFPTNEGSIQNLLIDTEWLSPKTLFIINGDLVDPHCSGTDTCYRTLPSSFEFLVHAFLYNMRIKAREKGYGCIIHHRKS